MESSGLGFRLLQSCVSPPWIDSVVRSMAAPHAYVWLLCIVQWVVLRPSRRIAFITKQTDLFKHGSSHRPYSCVTEFTCHCWSERMSQPPGFRASLPARLPTTGYHGAVAYPAASTSCWTLSWRI